MEELSRRGMFWLFAGAGAGLVAAPVVAAALEVPVTLPVTTVKDVFVSGFVPLVEDDEAARSGPGAQTHVLLRRHFEKVIYRSWFRSLEFESFDGTVVTFSVPVKFVRNWISEHYTDGLLTCARAEFASAERVCVTWRSPQRDREADRLRVEAQVRAIMDEV